MLLSPYSTGAYLPVPLCFVPTRWWCAGDRIEAEDGRAQNREYHVGTFATGQEKTGHLMEKPKKWHEVDQAKKQAKIDQNERAIFVDGEPEMEQGMSNRDKRVFYTKTAKRSSSSPTE